MLIYSFSYYFVVNTSAKNSAITTAVAVETLKSHTVVTSHAQKIYSVT